MINEKDNVKLWRNSNKKIIVKYNTKFNNNKTLAKRIKIEFEYMNQKILGGILILLCISIYHSCSNSQLVMHLSRQVIKRWIKNFYILILFSSCWLV